MHERRFVAVLAVAVVVLSLAAGVGAAAAGPTDPGPVADRLPADDDTDEEPTDDPGEELPDGEPVDGSNDTESDDVASEDERPDEDGVVEEPQEETNDEGDEGEATNETVNEETDPDDSTVETDPDDSTVEGDSDGTTVDVGTNSHGTSGLDVRITQIRADDFPEIDVYATISDGGSPVTGLTRSNFDVAEDGTSQTLTSIRQLGRIGGDVSAALVVDRSGSMSGTAIANAKAAAKQFVGRLQPGDEAAVVSFASDVTIDQRWSRNKAVLNGSIDAISARGSTSIFDGTLEAVREASPRTGRSAVIVLADGESNDDRNTKRDVISEAQAKNVPIYTIGLDLENEGNLRDLARETGGAYYRAADSSDLDDIYRNISESIRNQYLLTYDTTNTATDGTTRTVALVATDSGETGSDTGQYIAPCAPLPTADFTVSVSGRTITVDASPSSPSSIISSYEWDFDNDGVIDATGRTASHTYSTRGTYEVRLVVAKPCGASDTIVKEVALGSAFFRVDAVSAPGSVAQGDPLTVDSTITNTGSVSATKPVSLVLRGTNTSVGIGSADILFAIDTSGSMSDEISAVRNGLINFTNTLESQGVDVRYAVLTFADKVPYNVRQKYTSNVTRIQQTLDALSTGGGTEQSWDVANDSIDIFDERAGAQEYFLIFTDEDADTATGDVNDPSTLPGSLGSTPTASDVASRLDAEGVRLFGITQPEPQLDVGELSIGRVANRSANGQYFNINDANFAAKFENEIAGTIANASVGQLLTLTAGETDTVSLTIPGSTTSRLAPGFYTATVSTPDDARRTTVEIVAGGGGSATFQVSSLSLPASATRGDAVTGSVTITNTGSVSGTASVDLVVDGTFSDTTSVTLSPGESQSVSFTLDTSGLSIGTHTVGAQTADDSTSTTIDITGGSGGSNAISLSDASASSGSSVTLTLSASAGDVAGYRAELQFDPTALSFASATGVDLSDPVTNVDSTTGEVVLTQSSTSGVDDPTLAELTFDVSSAAASGSYSVSFVESGTSLNDPSSDLPIGTYDDGEIDVDTCVPGDADASGSVTSLDATQTLRYVAGLSTVGSFDPGCADISGDGVVTALDATQILRKVAGLPVSSRTTAASEPGTAASASDVTTTSGTLSVGSATDSSGSTVTVPLEVTGASVAGYEANITFDPGVVQFAGASGIDFSDPIVRSDNSAGYVFVTQSSASAESSPTLAELSFQLVGSSGSSTSLSLVPGDTRVNNETSTLPVSLSDGSISVGGGGSGSATFELSGLSVPGSATVGDTVTVSGTVTNTGSAAGSGTVELVAGGTVYDSTTVSLSAGASTSVSLTLDTSSLSPGDFNVGLDTGDDAATQTLTVTGSGGGTGDADLASAVRTPPGSISTGGTATVTVEVTMDGDGGPLSVNENFSGAVTDASIVSVTVDGSSASPIIAKANTDAAVVAMAGLGSNADVAVTYELDATASAGAITITGNVSSNGTGSLGTDVVAVTPCSLLPFAQGYDADGDCAISLTELGRASTDFANGRITLSKLGQVSMAYANT